MKYSAAPTPYLQNQVTNLFFIIRDEAMVSSYAAIPAMLFLSRHAHPFFSMRRDAHLLSNLYHSNSIYQPDANPEVVEVAVTSTNELMSILSLNTRQRIEDVIDSLKLPALSQAEFEGVFDFALDQFSRNNRYSSEFTVPAELAELIASIYEAKPGMCVYNLQAGPATLIPFLDPGVEYIGQEQNSEIRKLATLRLAAYQRSSAYLLSEIGNEQWALLPTADLILVTLPVFGHSNRMGRLQTDSLYNMPADVALVNTIIRHLQPRTRAVIPVAYGFLFQQGKAHRQLRKELITSGVLEAVIEFPAGLLSPTGVRMALLLINNTRPTYQPVLLLDAEPYTRRKGRQVNLDSAALLDALVQPNESNGSILLSKADFSQQDYDFTRGRYLLPTQPSQNQARLDQVVRALPLSGEYPSEGRLVRIGDLKSDNLSFSLASDELPVDYFNKRRLVRLQQDALLVALQGGRLKPTWYSHQPGGSVYLSPTSILPLQITRPDEVLLDYLIAELNSEFVQQQLRNLNIGSAMPAIRKADLWRLIINLPSLEEQRNLVRMASEQAVKIKQVESDAVQTERALKAEAYAQLAALKHALGRPQLNLTSNVDLLEAAIHYAASNNTVLAPQSPLFPSESTSVQDTIAAIKRDLEFMFQTLNRNEAELVLEEYPLQAIDILAFLREEVSHVRAGLPPFTIALDENFAAVFDLPNSSRKVRVAQRIDSVTVQGNRYLLKLLLNHVIDNAQRHGFSNRPKELNKVVVTVEEIYVEENNLSSFALGITIANNGHSFPLNFDVAHLTRKGAKAGVTGNSGIGGYEVKQIVNYFGGELKVISQSGTEYPVAYQLELPVVDVQFKQVKK